MSAERSASVKSTMSVSMSALTKFILPSRLTSSIEAILRKYYLSVKKAKYFHKNVRNEMKTKVILKGFQAFNSIYREFNEVCILKKLGLHMTFWWTEPIEILNKDFYNKSWLIFDIENMSSGGWNFWPMENINWFLWVCR